MSLPAEVFETNRSLLWALCYRMTGSTADADDLVQETFIKALENPPRRADEPLRPWLVRVALNLSAQVNDGEHVAVSGSLPSVSQSADQSHNLVSAVGAK